MKKAYFESTVFLAFMYICGGQIMKKSEVLSEDIELIKLYFGIEIPKFYSSVLNSQRIGVL